MNNHELAKALGARHHLGDTIRDIEEVLDREQPGNKAPGPEPRRDLARAIQRRLRGRGVLASTWGAGAVANIIHSALQTWVPAHHPVSSELWVEFWTAARHLRKVMDGGDVGLVQVRLFAKTLDKVLESEHLVEPKQPPPPPIAVTRELRTEAAIAANTLRQWAAESSQQFDRILTEDLLKLAEALERGLEA